MQNSRKRIMILGASILQLPAIEKAEEMGLEVLAVDMNPHAVGFKKADVPLLISTIDIPAVIRAAKDYHIDGVMTLASDMPMRTVAAVAKECGIVGIDEVTALKATNKVKMRQALKELDVPIPEFHVINSREQYDDIVSMFTKRGIKFIVKPADNSGSRGIFLVEDLGDSDSINAAFHHSKENSRSGDILVEEYMEGPEVSVETISLNSVCHIIQITDKLTTGSPYFVEMGHSQPTRLPPNVVEDIRSVAKAAVSAIGIKDGPSHTEIKATKTGAKIVELGARLGGDCITTHLVPLSTGINMVECCIRIALGEKPDIVPKNSKASAIRYFCQKTGKITGIDGLDEAKKAPGVVQVNVVHGVGERVTEVTDSASRMGFVVSQDVTSTFAIRDCELALEKIKINYERSNNKLDGK